MEEPGRMEGQPQRKTGKGNEVEHLLAQTRLGTLPTAGSRPGHRLVAKISTPLYVARSSHFISCHLSVVGCSWCRNCHASFSDPVYHDVLCFPLIVNNAFRCSIHGIEDMK